MHYPSKNFRQNPFTSLRVIRWTDRQTDRTKNITSFFGGGNNDDKRVVNGGRTVTIRCRDVAWLVVQLYLEDIMQSATARLGLLLQSSPAFISSPRALGDL